MSLTISGHAHGETLFEAAVLAPVSVHPHDETLLILHTHLVVNILLNAASEETLEKAREGGKKHSFRGILCVGALALSEHKARTYERRTQSLIRSLTLQPSHAWTP